MLTCGTRDCQPCTNPDYEKGMMRFASEWINDRAGLLNGCAVDCGAHTGLWSLYLDEIYPVQREIIAIEPYTPNYEALCANASMNIRCFHNAVWNTGRILGLKLEKHDARHYLVPAGFDRKAQCTSAITIDWLIAEKKIDLLKLDIEGAEYQALQGAEHTLKNNDCLVIVEFCDAHFKRYNTNKKMVKNLLADWNYDFARKIDELNYSRLDDRNVKLLAFSRW